MERISTHPTLLDGAAADLGGPRTRAFLDQCERLIPWDELARRVADVFPRPAKGAISRGGRPHWPVRLYVKCLMLQKWFNLSVREWRDQADRGGGWKMRKCEQTDDAACATASLLVFIRLVRPCE